jgi:hypothetical protein
MNLPDRNCKTCGRLFTPDRRRNIFCSRQCYRDSYQIAKQTENNPMCICPYCKEKTRLDFDPKKEYKKWALFVCPLCGKPRIPTSYPSQVPHMLPSSHSTLLIPS